MKTTISYLSNFFQVMKSITCYKFLSSPKKSTERPSSCQNIYEQQKLALILYSILSQHEFQPNSNEAQK